MTYAIYLNDQDCTDLKKLLAFLGKILFAADQAKQEAQQERFFNDVLKNDTAFASILIKRRKQIPMKYREIFNEQWFADHTRQRVNGLYEIRCSINKVPITGSGKTLDTAAENFINNLIKANRSAGTAAKQPPKPEIKRILFNEFAEQWCEVVKKPTVKAVTFNSIVINYKAHIKPYFRGKYVDEITAMQIQPLFNKLSEAKISRAAQSVKQFLNQIFNAAIAERLITFNPMQGVKVLKHHNKNGVALTVEEERAFLRALEVSPYKLTYALMLFCGMRRGELASARIESGFIVVKDGKRRISDVETERRIPITPMLQPYLQNVSEADFKKACALSSDKLSREFKKLCEAHHLHELRHTFITRCQECGIAREVVSVWAGHAADTTMTSNVYTHFSAEFMLAEAKKVDYYNRLRA